MEEIMICNCEIPFHSHDVKKIEFHYAIWMKENCK